PAERPLGHDLYQSAVHCVRLPDRHRRRRASHLRRPRRRLRPGILCRHHAFAAATRGAGVDLLRLPADCRLFHEQHHGRHHRPQRAPWRLRRRDRTRRPHFGAQGPDAGGARAGHVAPGGHPQDRPAASADPHDAGARIALHLRHQGQRHCLGHRGAGTAAAVADRRRADLSLSAGLYDPDDCLLSDLLPGRAWRRPPLPPGRASRFVMTAGWSLVWDNAGRFAEGALLTVELTVVTMLLAIPGGLLLAFLRLSRWRLIRFAATAFVELFRSTPLILQIYWVYYVLPSFTDILLP